MNRLSAATSLYLQQHADNPVDWQPWEDAALARARELDRPILLSIGYSACHWCHVMAHESFEDPATARWMNELFVNIKVDREERPDLDKVYQLSHQLLTGRGGGWPLTVFLDPRDLTPFFAGTYFPPEPRHGLPAFSELLQKVRQWFDEHRDQVSEQNRRLAAAIAATQSGGGPGALPDDAAFALALNQLQQRFDTVHGGFGGAPKFPQAPLLGLLEALSRSTLDGADDASEMLRFTLRKMALSGLRDHLDGGFFRYTVDGSWTIPHFEKMLYDNALLLPLYAEAAARWEEPLLNEAAAGIVAWLETHMRDPSGGFHASIDADADGKEGGFHVWHRDEVRALLETGEYAVAAAAFGLEAAPNFEHHSWHLVRRDATPTVPDEILEKLRKARAKRVPPATDTKLLTSWNALCIEGLVRAGLALERPDWLDLAEQAMDFVRDRMWQNGRLSAVYAGGQAGFVAYLDDHAFLLNALLALLQARWRPAYLEFATAVARVLLAGFGDGDRGGFFFSDVTEDVPIQRLRPLQDDATPGGNGIAALALLRLGRLTGDGACLEAAERTLGAAAGEMAAHPLPHASLMVALREFLHPPVQVIVSGEEPRQSDLFRVAAREAVRGHDRVNCYAIAPDAGELPGVLGGHGMTGRTMAFVCKGLHCLPPVEHPDQLAELLRQAD